MLIEHYPPTDYVRADKPLYSIFSYDGDELALNVGYSTPAEVPSWVKIIGLELNTKNLGSANQYYGFSGK